MTIMEQITELTEKLKKLEVELKQYNEVFRKVIPTVVPHCDKHDKDYDSLWDTFDVCEDCLLEELNKDERNKRLTNVIPLNNKPKQT